MPNDREQHSALERLVREGTDADLRRFLLILQPPELADLLEALRSREDRTRAFRAILGPNQAEVLRGMEDQERAKVVEDLTAKETAALVQSLQSDDAVDVLQDMPEDQQERVLEHIEPKDQAELREILTYPEDSAGGIMQTELVAVRGIGPHATPWRRFGGPATKSASCTRSSSSTTKGICAAGSASAR